MISERTKAALQAAKARGVKLGGDRGNLPEVAEEGRLAALKNAPEGGAEQRAADLASIIAELRAQGATWLRRIGGV